MKAVPTKHAKLISFLVSLATCCLLGSILIFPLISQELIHQLHFKTFEVNIIISLISIGMYLCLPGLGYLSDNYGNNLLSIIAIVCLSVPYYLNSVILTSSSANKLISFGITYGILGLGTSSLYFLSLLNCSKIYPHHKGLSISLPVTCYGLSSLVSTQILKFSWFHQDSQLDLVRIFRFFSGLYFLLGALSFLCQTIVHTDMIKTPEQTELIPISSIEPPNHKQNFIRFLKNPVMYILLASLFLNIGPLETYQNNLNTILTFKSPDSTGEDLNSQIIILSIFSTITRLAVGVLSDYYNNRNILMVLLAIGIINQVLAIDIMNVNITILTILDGISYGGIFTIYPTILADLWGVDILGSTWGTFMVSPAISSILFSLMYGHSLDVFKSVYYYFMVTSISFVISFGFVVSIRTVKPFTDHRAHLEDHRD